MVDVDLFDRRILAVLKDGEPREFLRLLSELGVSHNTLRLGVSRNKTVILNRIVRFDAVRCILRCLQ